MPNRILITGASGFVGTYLRAAIAKRWPNAIVTALGVQNDIAKAGFGDSSSLRALDLTDRAATEAIVDETRPDTIIHLAGQASVARGDVGGGDLTWAINVGGAVNLATALARYTPHAHVLIASSSEVYGASFLGSPVCETSVLAPMNAYAKSKAVAERVFSDILPETVRLIVARPFNHTGAGQQPDFVLPSFAAQLARMEAGLQTPTMTVGNLDVARDFLDVRDVVDAYLKLIEAAPTLSSRFVVNIASGRAFPLRDLLAIMRGMAKVRFEIVVDPARLRKIDLPTAFADPALLRAVTGWAPSIPIEATLADVVAGARQSVRSAA